MPKDLDSFIIIFPYSRVNANGICAVIAALDQEIPGLHIDTPNFRNEPEEIMHNYQKYEEVILGLSYFSTQLIDVAEKTEAYRKAFGNRLKLVIAGGHHATGSPKSALMNGADVICIGEGEKTIVDMISAYINENPLEDCKGIAYLEDGQLIRTSKQKLVDLNDYPPFPVDRGLVRPIEITRGCAHKCRFCQTRNTGEGIRHRSLEQIIKYSKETIKRFSDRRPDMRFISPNALSYGSKDGVTVDYDVVENMLREVRRLIGGEGKIYFGSFPSEIRPETIDKRSISILKKYTSATKLVIGSQSGSDRILDIAQRGHSVEETETAVQMLLDAGFEVDVDIIFGLPGEEEKDIQLTLEHMQRLVEIGARIHSHTFMPLPGTPFAKQAPGEIHDRYKHTIQLLQHDRKLSGYHVKQEKAAKFLHQQRKKEKKQ